MAQAKGNEPLMHATIALAARIAEHEPAPTRMAALELAREVAKDCGLNEGDSQKLWRAAMDLSATQTP